MKRKKSRISGFILNTEPIRTEISQCATVDKEFAGTVDKALGVVAKLKTIMDSGEIQIYLRQGTYNVGNGINIDKTMSGTKSLKVTISAYKNENVVLTNGTVLKNSNFIRAIYGFTLKGLQGEAKEKVYMTNLTKQNITNFGSISRDNGNNASSPMLIENQKLRIIARWPNEGHAYIKDVLNAGNGVTFSINEYKIDQWAEAKSAWIKGFFKFLWADDTLMVKSMDAASKSISTLHTPDFGILPDHPWYIYNLIEELDAPGEWFLDCQSGYLYYYPVDNILKSEIRLVTNTAPLLNIDNAKDITFKNLTFDGTCGNAINMNNTENIIIDNFIIRNIGARAANVVNGKHNGFINSHFYDLGKGGVYFCDGDFMCLIPSGNYVENCNFERFSLYKQTYTPAVSLRGVGDKV